MVVESTYFDACWTRCPSSGITSFSMASATAAGEPGNAMMMQPPDEACAGAAEHRSRADLLVTEHAKQLAESVEPFLQQRVDRFVGAVAGRDAGSAGRDDHLDAAVREVPLDRGVYLRRVVPDERAAGEDVTRGGQQVGNRAAAGVVLQRPGVADGDDEALDGIVERWPCARRRSWRRLYGKRRACAPWPDQDHPC